MSRRPAIESRAVDESIHPRYCGRVLRYVQQAGPRIGVALFRRDSRSHVPFRADVEGLTVSATDLRNSPSGVSAMTLGLQRSGWTKVHRDLPLVLRPVKE